MKKILSIILLNILLYSCNYNYEEFEKEEFQKIYELFKNEYNLILDKNRYEMTYISGPSHSLSLFPGNSVPQVLKLKEPIKYKSKYFSDDPFLNNMWEEGDNNFKIYKDGELYKDDDVRIIWEIIKDSEETEKAKGKIPFFNKKNNFTFFLIIDYYGLRPYVLNELIYDKSKGNDFEKIEAILRKYPGMTVINQNDSWECGDLNKKDPGETISFMFVQDDECIISKNSNIQKDDTTYSLEKVKEYGEKFEKYFNNERKLEEINWDEFLEYNNITPIIKLYVNSRKRISRKSAQKILKEISPYYNKKSFIIVIDAEDENGNHVLVW